VTEGEFQQSIERALELHTQALVSVLRELVRYNYPSEVVSVDFEVFPDSFTSGFPVRAFFIDETNSEYFVVVGDEARYPSPVDPGLLNIPRVYDLSLEKALAVECPHADAFTLAGGVIISWFARCWAEAGGLRFSRQSSICLHDDLRVYDLVAGRWRTQGIGAT
jgi:hypothetical protein